MPKNVGMTRGLGKFGQGAAVNEDRSVVSENNADLRWARARLDQLTILNS